MSLFLVLLMVLRLPRATLFPYTTLFRSERGEPGEQRAPDREPRVAPAPALHERADEREPQHEAYADRKSTRLNSSHSQMSYAVFRLKKTIMSLTLITPSLSLSLDLSLKL